MVAYQIWLSLRSVLLFFLIFVSSSNQSCPKLLIKIPGRNYDDLLKLGLNSPESREVELKCLR